MCVSQLCIHVDAARACIIHDTCFLIPNFPLSSVDVDSDWCNTSLYTGKKHECEFVSLNTLAQRLGHIVHAHNNNMVFQSQPTSLLVLACVPSSSFYFPEQQPGDKFKNNRRETLKLVHMCMYQQGDSTKEQTGSHHHSLCS